LDGSGVRRRSACVIWGPAGFSLGVSVWLSDGALESAI